MLFFKVLRLIFASEYRSGVIIACNSEQVYYFFFILQQWKHISSYYKCVHSPQAYNIYLFTIFHFEIIWNISVSHISIFLNVTFIFAIINVTEKNKNHEKKDVFFFQWSLKKKFSHLNMQHGEYPTFFCIYSVRNFEQAFLSMYFFIFFLFIQRCAGGYYRDRHGRCVPCACNGLSEDCDDSTGRCLVRIMYNI